MKYEYLLHAWGGFWNQENFKVHKEPNFEYKWFDTYAERQAEVQRLQKIASERADYLIKNKLFNDSCIAMHLTEGYLTRYKFVIQSIIEVQGELKTIENDLGYGFWSDSEMDELGNFANYFKEYKYDLMYDADHTRLFSTIILRK